MARVYTDRAKLRMIDGGFAAATKNIGAFKGTGPSGASIAAMNFVSDLTAGNTEATASGYARAAIVPTYAEVDASTRAEITWPTTSVGSGVAAGETYTVFACWNTAGGADSARELYWVDVLAASIVTNGSGVSYSNGSVDTLT